MSTAHTSPQSSKNRPDDLAAYYKSHRAHLNTGQMKYVSLASGSEEIGGTYRYVTRPAVAEIRSGGSLVKVSTSKRSSGSNGPEFGGGVRGEVLEYSSASRRRLMRMIASTERKNKPIFVTLTYPDEFPENAKKWKRDIDTFGKRFRRKYENSALVWRIEFKDRQSGKNASKLAPHFHLLIWGVDLYNFRSFCADAWYSVVGHRDERHRHAGTQADRLKSFAGTMRYVSKYLAKVEDLPHDWKGRVWGVINREKMPWAILVSIPLTNEMAIKLVRLGRKMCKLDGKVLSFGLTWIMNAERLLDYIEHLEGFT